MRRAPQSVTLEVPDSLGRRDCWAADVVRGHSIRIYGTYSNHVRGPQPFDRTFQIGDRVERDSYNLSFLGTVVAIGLKTVTIKDDNLAVTSRLPLDTFIRRNWDLDVATLLRRNAEWSD